MITDFTPGALVHVRNRDWVVMPSDDDNLILLKPLDGSDDDITGIYKPLEFPDDIPKPASFLPPDPGDLGDFASARLLFNAGRLSVRNAAGPFRSLGKLSFRPRAYQMVPLIMALKQEFPIRLLIADDVGVGKTIEALTVLKELLERGEIKRFAVITPPHLCDQWQDEIKDKFDIDAVVIRSNTEARLDRQIPGDAPVFQYYPFQVISIDYIKSPNRMRDFVRECPEFVIVDEAHSCSRHSTSKKSEQQRHDLIKKISGKKDQHLLLLTATPHSGKPEQFNSLLSLIDEKYLTMDLNSADRSQRRELARYFVQRRRRDVEKWMGQDTPFPKRDSGEINYSLSPKYADFYKKIHEFALGEKRSQKGGSEAKTRAHYWSSLSLLHGVMSSPGAGVEMLNNRIKKREDSDETDSANDNDNVNEIYNPLMDDGLEAYDHTPLFGPQDWSKYEIERMGELKKELAALGGVKHDLKAKSAVQVLKDWLKKGYIPVVFCTFIATANYLGDVLKKAFGGDDAKIEVRVVTSEEPDEVRRERIEDMAPFKKKILVATDCLSEGVNLQEQFNAVLHYDLPWNPNRLEQRDGRVDRYGQQKDQVKTFLLKSSDNPIDEAVYNVLLRKVREIHRATGIFVPFSGASILDAVLEAVMSKRKLEVEEKQLTLDFGEDDPFKENKLEVSRQLDEAAEREKESRSIFAQHAVKAEEVEKDLKEADQAIGSPDVVESFAVNALRFMGVQIDPDKKENRYTLFPQNLEDTLKDAAPGRKKGVLPDRVKVSFFSPTPAGHHYIGRNHAFTEQLCRLLLAGALDPSNKDRPARAAVMRSNAVKAKTTLLLLRVRNVIQKRASKDQLVGEEMLAWGYRGFPEDRTFLDFKEVTRLMNEAQASATQGTVTTEAAAQALLDELDDISEAKPILDELAAQRAQSLVDAYDRFHKVVRGSRYSVSQPVQPMDIMGLYILLPEMK